MALKETLTNDMKAAMRAKDKVTLSTVRLLLAELKNMEIDAADGLSEADELQLLTRHAKRRREAIVEYDKADRAELAAAERAELVVIEGYLPKQLTPEEATDVAREVIASVGAESMRDMGKVMGALMGKLKGRFPGKAVKPIVEGLLKG